MSSVGEDFPRQQERVRGVWALYRELGPVGAFGAAHIDAVLKRAAGAQASGDVIQILKSYNELVEVQE